MRGSALSQPAARTALQVGAIAAAGCTVGVVVSLLSTVPGAEFAAAIASLSAVLVGAHVVARRRSGDALNLLSLCALFYLLAFVAGGIYTWFNPILTLQNVANPVSRADLVAAIGLITIAWICFALGYMGDPLRTARRLIRPPKGIAARAPRGPFIITLLALGWSARLLRVAEGLYFHIHTNERIPTGTSWFVSMLAFLPLIATGIAGADAFAAKSSDRRQQSRVLFAILVAGELAWALPTGAREQVVDVIALVVIVRYYAAGKLISWKWGAVLMAVLVFGVFPVIHTYRNADFRSSPTGALLGATGQLRSAGPTGALQSGADTLARFADVTTLVRVLQQGRHEMHHSLGDIALQSAADFIPRAILPEKANIGLDGNTFGRAYGFLSAQDFITAIAPTQVTEIYIAGGWLGISVGMAILGGMLRLVDEYLVARRRDGGALALYAVIAPLIAMIENPIAVGFIGTIKSALFLGGVLALVGWLMVPVAERSGERDQAQVIL